MYDNWSAFTSKVAAIHYVTGHVDVCIPVMKRSVFAVKTWKMPEYFVAVKSAEVLSGATKGRLSIKYFIIRSVTSGS